MAEPRNDVTRHVPRHEYTEGETFEYLYEATDAVFATEQVYDGRLPRITDVVTIHGSRTTLSYTIVSDEGRLRKQVVFSGMQFRETTADDLAQRRSVPWQPASEVVPGLPEAVTHTYDLGGDGVVASDLTKVFGEHREPVRFIDAFTFTATLEPFPRSMSPGDVRLRPALDVDFYGSTYHSNASLLFYDRVEEIDGVPHAFVKLQAPGNHTSNRQSDGNWVETALIPLEGPTAGLIARGELQELVYDAGSPEGVRTTVRQNSLTLQTPRTGSLAP